MRLGSGDTTNLLQGVNTKGFRKLLSEFIIDEPAYRNALNSPIHALRTGAILEEVMYKFLPDVYMTQVRAVNKDYDVLTSTLDFAIIEKGEVKEFIEMKSINFDDFISLHASVNRLQYVKKNYKNYYNQTQQQLLVTGLEYCTLLFLIVYDENNDFENWNREIKESEIIRITITRDINVINRIINRVKIFQQIKNYFNECK